MSAIKYRELKQMYESYGPERTVKHLREAFRAGHLKAEDFSLRELAEATVGAEWVKRMDPRGGGVRLLEAGDAVDVTRLFQHHRADRLSSILDAYTQEAFVVSKLVSTIPTRFDGEKIPGIGRIRDETAEVRPGMPYPNVGLSEDYIETPSTTKHGFIVPVTREAIFFDRTHLILQRAAEVGEGARAAQGKAADRPGDRREEQLQVEGDGLQHLLRTGRQRPLGQRAPTRNSSTGRTSTPPSNSSPTSSTRTPASRCWSSRTRCWSCRPIATPPTACCTRAKSPSAAPRRRTGTR